MEHASSTEPRTGQGKQREKEGGGEGLSLPEWEVDGLQQGCCDGRDAAILITHTTHILLVTESDGLGLACKHSTASRLFL
jgi:hypothetical protein